MCMSPDCNGVPVGVKVQRPGDGQIIYGCCLVEEGYYCVWLLEHMSMVCEEWAELCDLRQALHSVRHISFNVVQERQRARTVLNNLKKTAPFNECERFPWRKVYVNLNCGVYGNLWENLLGALDFKDRESEKEMKYGQHSSSDEDHHKRNEYTLDDSKTQFRNTIKQFINELCKRTEVFDRVRFETEYNLRWCKGSCPTEPADGSLPPPDAPNQRKYGDIMGKLRDLDMDPKDFETFGPMDIVRGDFRCDRDTQELGSGIAQTRLPRGSRWVYVFTSGEYAKCDRDEERVMGYVYDVVKNQLLGPRNLKEPMFTEEDDIMSLLGMIDADMLRKILVKEKAVRKSSEKYPDSRLEKGKQRQRYADIVRSSSSDKSYEKEFE